MNRPTWLTRNVFVLSAVSFLQDAASELLYPILPILLTSVLGAPAAVVGLTEGLAEGAAAVTKYASGRWSDRIGRRPLVTAGYGLAAVGKVVVAMAGVWPVVLVGRVTDRLGKGMRGAPRDALLADGIAPTDLSRVFGFHRAMDTMGAVVGPLLGLAVLWLTHDNLKVALWIAVVPAVLSAALTLRVREKPRSAAVRAARPQVGSVERDLAKPDPLPTAYWRVVWVLGLVALVNFPDALVLLRVSQVGFSITGVLAVYVLYNLVYTALSYPAGVLADHLPRARIYALGLACFAIGYVGLGLAHGTVAVVALMLTYGGFNAFTDGVGKAWISSLVPPRVRGHAQGVFQGLSGGAVLVAGLWAGLAWNLGPGHGAVPLIVAGSLAGLAGLALWISGRRLG